MEKVSDFKRDLQDEGARLEHTIQEVYDDSLNMHRLIKYKLSNEQRYKNWLEKARVFIYENRIDPAQYDEFMELKSYISPQHHRSIMAIINSL